MIRITFKIDGRLSVIHRDWPQVPCQLDVIRLRDVDDNIKYYQVKHVVWLEDGSASLEIKEVTYP